MAKPSLQGVLPDALLRAYQATALSVRSRRGPARWLFGLELPPGRVEIPVWDFTTLVLRRALARQVRDGQRVLEIGVGPHAVLCVFLARRYRLDLQGVDIQEERVAGARATLGRNDLSSVAIARSDLFENIAGQFDVVFFNATYIPSETGRRMGFLDDERRERERLSWDGGGDGLQTVRRFLDALPGRLLPGGRALLGVNLFYVEPAAVEEAVRRSGLALLEVVRMPFNPSAAYVVAPVRTSERA
jgi:methylase of polypeptide subunit release factors